VSKFLGFRVHRAYKIGILNHGKEETFGDGAQDGVVDRQGFDPADNMNVLSSTLVMLYRATAPRIQCSLMS